MSCESCTQKIIEQNATQDKVYKDAQAAANESGQWFAIYTDEYGNYQFIRADQANGIPIKRYVSPNV